MFTPKDIDGKRLKFRENEVKVLEGQIYQRGLGLHAIIEIRGKKYKVYGAACGLPNCQCDEIIKEVK